MYGDTLRKEALNILPLSVPISVAVAFKAFTGIQIEVVPVILGNYLKGLYLKDAIPLITGCQDGNACVGRVPPDIFREIPYLNIAANDDDQTEKLKNAIESETSLALFDGRIYLGMVPLKQLITFAHRNQIKEAITTNPLTGLPGNVSIEKEFERRSGKEPFAICYVDINDFKSFNDKYGISLGDKVIKYVSCVLAEACKNHFVGHVGGDDFVVMTPVAEAEQIYSEITSEFDKQIGLYYNDRDRDQGFITGEDRRGVICRFPLMRLALAATVVSAPCSFNEVTMALASLKSHVKIESRKKGESLYAFDKRENAVAY